MTKRLAKKKPAVKRTARVSHRDACPLCQKYTQWKPSVLKTIEEARQLSKDLADGCVTREKLISRGEFVSADEFIRQLHRRCACMP